MILWFVKINLSLLETWCQYHSVGQTDYKEFPYCVLFVQEAMKCTKISWAYQEMQVLTAQFWKEEILKIFSWLHLKSIKICNKHLHCQRMGHTYTRKQNCNIIFTWNPSNIISDISIQVFRAYTHLISVIRIANAGM